MSVAVSAVVALVFACPLWVPAHYGCSTFCSSRFSRRAPAFARIARVQLLAALVVMVSVVVDLLVALLDPRVRY